METFKSSNFWVWIFRILYTNFSLTTRCRKAALASMTGSDPNNAFFVSHFAKASFGKHLRVSWRAHLKCALATRRAQYRKRAVLSVRQTVFLNCSLCTSPLARFIARKKVGLSLEWVATRNTTQLEGEPEPSRPADSGRLRKTWSPGSARVLLLPNKTRLGFFTKQPRFKIITVRCHCSGCLGPSLSQCAGNESRVANLTCELTSRSWRRKIIFSFALWVAKFDENSLRIFARRASGSRFRAQLLFKFTFLQLSRLFCLFCRDAPTFTVSYSHRLLIVV